jgi:hypothetical protein
MASTLFSLRGRLLSFSTTIVEGISIKDVAFVTVRFGFIYSSWRPGSLYQRLCIYLSWLPGADYQLVILLMFLARPSKYVLATRYLLLGGDVDGNKCNTDHSAKLHGGFGNKQGEGMLTLVVDVVPASSRSSRRKMLSTYFAS